MFNILSASFKLIHIHPVSSSGSSPQLVISICPEMEQSISLHLVMIYGWTTSFF